MVFLSKNLWVALSSLSGSVLLGAQAVDDDHARRLVLGNPNLVECV